MKVKAQGAFSGMMRSQSIANGGGQWSKGEDGPGRGQRVKTSPKKLVKSNPGDGIRVSKVLVEHTKQEIEELIKAEVKLEIGVATRHLQMEKGQGNLEAMMLQWYAHAQEYRMRYLRAWRHDKLISWKGELPTEAKETATEMGWTTEMIEAVKQG